MNTNEYYLEGAALIGGGAVVCRVADLESGDTGRDEAGYLHRWVLRKGLRRWEITYRDLSESDGAALLNQLPKVEEFLLEGPEGSCMCYVKEVTHRRRQTLTGYSWEITITLEEC